MVETIQICYLIDPQASNPVDLAVSLPVSQGWNQGVLAGSGGKSASRLFQVVGRIELHVVVRLRSLFPCCRVAGRGGLFSASSGCPRSLVCAPFLHLQGQQWLGESFSHHITLTSSSAFLFPLEGPVWLIIHWVHPDSPRSFTALF